MVVLSIISLSAEEQDAEFAELLALHPLLRSIVLSKTDDPEEALAVLGKGAKGYVSP